MTVRFWRTSPSPWITDRASPARTRWASAGCRGRAFTLVEVIVAAMVLAVAFTGMFATYSQCMRMLDSQRQLSRAQDIALANIEFLRTCTWDQFTNIVTTSESSTISQYSSNLIESVSMTLSNNPICTHLVTYTTDPLHIGLRNVERDLVVYPNPVFSTTTVVQVTVLVSYDTVAGVRLTNSLTTAIARGGLTAAITQ